MCKEFFLLEVSFLTLGKSGGKHANRVESYEFVIIYRTRFPHFGTKLDDFGPKVSHSAGKKADFLGAKIQSPEMVTKL